MLHYTVNQNGGGDFVTITEAVQAVPYHTAALISIADGVYREKLYCDKHNITLRGQSQSGTRLVYGDGAKHVHADGTPYGTFRSWTALFSGGSVCLQQMTVENDAGDGRSHGQAIAAYMDAAFVHCTNVTFTAHQDTLFTAPLPKTERQPRGFLGPREHTPRRPSVQWYENCTITGDIDFIYGGADALFTGCTLVMRERQETVNGYFAAPSTPENGVGYVFYRCAFGGQAGIRPASAYLARPWREYGKAAFLACSLSQAVHPDAFDDWDNPANRTTCTFAEYASTGPAAGQPRAFGQTLDTMQAQALFARMQQRLEPFLPQGVPEF